MKRSATHGISSDSMRFLRHEIIVKTFYSEEIAMR